MAFTPRRNKVLSAPSAFRRCSRRRGAGRASVLGLGWLGGGDHPVSGLCAPSSPPSPWRSLRRLWRARELCAGRFGPRCVSRTATPATSGRRWLRCWDVEDGVVASLSGLRRFRRATTRPSSAKLRGLSPPVIPIGDAPVRSRRASGERHKAARLRGALSEFGAVGGLALSVSTGRRRPVAVSGRAGAGRDLEGLFSDFILSRVLSVKVRVSRRRELFRESVDVVVPCTGYYL